MAVRRAALAAALVAACACDGEGPPPPSALASTTNVLSATGGSDGASGPDPACIAGRVLDTSGAVWSGATTPDCTATDDTLGADGGVDESVLPPCPRGQTAGPAACWFLENRPDERPEGWRLGFNRPGPPPAAVETTLSCAVLACPAERAANEPPGC